MLIERHRLQAGLEAAGPIHHETPARNFGKQVARNDRIVLVVFDQQNLDYSSGYHKGVT